HGRQAEVGTVSGGWGRRNGLRRPARRGWSPQPVPSTGVMRAWPPAGSVGFARANPCSGSGRDLDRLEQVTVGNEPFVAQRPQHPGEIDLAGDTAIAHPAGNVLEGPALQLVAPGLSPDRVEPCPAPAAVARLD